MGAFECDDWWECMCEMSLDKKKLLKHIVIGCRFAFQANYGYFVIIDNASIANRNKLYIYNNVMAIMIVISVLKREKS